MKKAKVADEFFDGSSPKETVIDDLMVMLSKHDQGLCYKALDRLTTELIKKEDEERERNALEANSKAEFSFFIPHLSDVFDTTEIFEVRMFPCHLPGDLSVGYLVSRKHKKIVGVIGGGTTYLNIPEARWGSSDFVSAPSFELLKKAARRDMDHYLSRLP